MSNIKDYVTREECQKRIDDAIRQHNRNASIISMWLGAFCLAAFTDGILRMVGQLPPFMGIDVNLMQDVIDNVKEEVIKVLS